MTVIVLADLLIKNVGISDCNKPLSLKTGLYARVKCRLRQACVEVRTS